jgi:hypothetical protein
MKPYDKVSSFRGANTLLQGQHINGQTYPYFNVTSGGIRCSKGTPIIKKPNPSLFVKGGTTKGKKSLDTEQIYGHGSQWGSMPRVTVLAGCRQYATALLCSADRHREERTQKTEHRKQNTGGGSTGR